MARKHTHGPWYGKPTGCGGQGLVCEEATGKNVAVAYDEADVHLIAAAPDMLEALLAAESLIFANSIAVGTQDYFRLRNILRGAINKAEDG